MEPIYLTSLLKIEDYFIKKIDNKLETISNNKENYIVLKEQNTKLMIEKLFIQYMQTIRDSFRIIKDISIAQNNLLDAQNWHKHELYAKEIELNYQYIIKNRDSKNKNKRSNKIYDFFSIKNFLSKNINLFIDYTLLKLYRITSDHHTNFIKILNFLITMIIFYGLEIFTLEISISKINFSKDFDWTRGIILGLLSALLGFILSEPFGKIIKKIFYIFVALFLSIFIFVFIMLIKEYISNLNVYFIYSIYSIILYIILLRLGFWFYDSKYINMPIITFIFSIIIYTILSCIMIAKPQLINPLIGVFKSDDLIQTHFFKKQLNEANKTQILALSQIMVDKNYVFDLNQINALNDDLKNVNLNDLKTFNEARTLILNDKERLNFLLETFEKNLKDDNETIKQNAIKMDKMLNLSKFSSALQKDEILKSAVQSTSVLYSIVLLLCLFSLIKTGRKNSIIPA